MLKILHLPTAVGGNAFGLSRGERKHDMHSDVMIMENHNYQYQADIDVRLDQISSRFRRYLKRLELFFQMRRHYNIFHFNFGRSLFHVPHIPLLHQADLPYYPREAKLFVTYQGCDARQKYPTMLRSKVAPCHNVNCYQGICNSGVLDQQRRQGIEKMAKYTRHMWALNPDLLHFLPQDKASFLPYTVCHHDHQPNLSHFEGTLTVVHAPTNKEAKGSAIILDALKRIQTKYPKLIEVVLVEGVPYLEALKIYRTADIVIDQVLAGWYGAFAVETMLMGKPVLARIDKSDLRFVPTQMAEDVLEAVVHIEPQTIYHVLERILHDRRALMRYAEAGLEYARKWHDPYFVASLTKAKYEESD